MKAEILVKDVNESSCLITIFYSRIVFDSWFCGSKPIGTGISGDCYPFGPGAIHLRDGRNVLSLDLDILPIQIPILAIQAGKSGKGWVKSSGFLKSGAITWHIWNTRRTGDSGDNWMQEKG